MGGPALAEECVALSVNSAGSTQEIGLSPGFGVGSGLKMPDWLSHGGFGQCWCV